MKQFSDYSEEEIEKAREIHEVIKELAEIDSRLKTLDLAIRQTKVAKSEELLPEFSDFPIALLLGDGNNVPIHPLVSDYYKIAHFFGDNRTKEELIEEAVENYSLESILLRNEARRLAMKYHELNETL